jgi:Uncharacterised methyltransferase family (DUF6094)
MALIFQRLARNFIKNGYFPTDEATLTRIFAQLDVGASQLRIFDPCCGEGTALADLKHHLVESGSTVSAIGVEFDEERAWHAKAILDTAIHADIHDVIVSQRSMGLLFLNPPYGQVVSDKAALSDRERGDRLEKVFCRQTFSTLQFGGVLVLIVPLYVMDAEFASLIARNFDRVAIYKAPEQRFKQCVVFGIKRRSDNPDPSVVKRLVAANQEDAIHELPELCIGEPYSVPAATDPGQFAIASLRLDARQLKAEMDRMQKATLWPKFSMMFQGQVQGQRRPLRGLSRWHLALALAAGQVNGLVTSKSTGQTFLIKGDTFKDKVVTVEIEVGEKGATREKRIATDRFVPMIRAIDFTPGEHFGQLVQIR